MPCKGGNFRLFPRELPASRLELNTLILEGMMVSDMSIGCGLRRYTVQYIYETTSSLPAYLKPGGGDLVIVVQDGYILGMARRDKRPLWQKLRGRVSLYFESRFPKHHGKSDVIGHADQSLGDCCAG